MSKLRWLEIAEYASLSGAVAGIAIAVLSGEIVYAAVSIFLALLLNLANRHQLKREYGELRRAIALIRQDLARIEEPRNDWEPQLKNLIDRLHREAESMNSGEKLEPLVVAMKEQRSRQQDLEQLVTLLKAQIETLTEQFKNRPELEQIETLTSVIVALKQFIDELPRPEQ